MIDDKKANLFAKLVASNKRATTDTAITDEPPAPRAEDVTPPPYPLPVEDVRPKTVVAKKKPEPLTGKRGNPDYVQANAYVPKSIRRSVDRILLDIDGLDYSTLIEDLLRKWLKSRGISE
jgi:hypothetical protein